MPWVSVTQVSQENIDRLVFLDFRLPFCLNADYFRDDCQDRQLVSLETVCGNAV